MTQEPNGKSEAQANQRCHEGNMEAFRNVKLNTHLSADLDFKGG